MRMRKKKHSDARLARCSEFLYAHEGEPLSDPSVLFGKSEGRVLLEIGAGKGAFACGMAKRNSDACYFAMERVSDCVVIAAERATEENIQNLKFVIDSADNLTRIFECGTVDGIFLNFSDPWTKKGYAKRRLTHRRYLSVYLNLLCDGGELCFKTDNVELFDFSLEEIEAMGLVPSVVTRDLHASEFNAENIRTEYEQSFAEQGMKINMLKVVKPHGYSCQIAPDLARDRVEYRRPKTTDSAK